MIKVLKFYADWCGPCKVLAPRIDALKEQYPDVEFIDVNIEEHPEMVLSHEVMSVPTIIIFDDDKQIDRMTGIVPDSSITKHFS